MSLHIRQVHGVGTLVYNLLMRQVLPAVGLCRSGTAGELNGVSTWCVDNLDVIRLHLMMDPQQSTELFFLLC